MMERSQTSTHMYIGVRNKVYILYITYALLLDKAYAHLSLITKLFSQHFYSDYLGVPVCIGINKYNIFCV